jgi:hypothetical protein
VAGTRHKTVDRSTRSLDCVGVTAGLLVYLGWDDRRNGDLRSGVPAGSETLAEPRRLAHERKIKIKSKIMKMIKSKSRRKSRISCPVRPSWS